MGCLHDPAKVQQTSSKCIQNTRANAERLLEVCWKFARRLLDRVNTLLKLYSFVRTIEKYVGTGPTYFAHLHVFIY